MKKMIITLTFLLFTVSINDSYSKDLSLKQVIELVLTESKDIQKANLTLKQMEEVINQVKGYKGFSVSTSINYDKSSIDETAMTFTLNPSDLTGNLIPQQYNMQGDFYSSTASIQISKPIYMFGKLNENIKAAKEYLQEATYGKQLAEKELKYAAESLYYTILYHQELLKVAKSSYKNALNSKKLLLNIGRPVKSDLIKLDADIAIRKPEIEKFQYAITETKRALKILCNIPLSEEIELTSDFKTITSNEYNKENGKLEALDYPEIDMIKARIKSSKHKAKSAIADIHPQIVSYAGYSQSMNSQFSSLDESMDTENTFIGVKLSIPLWDGGVARATANQELIEAQKAQLDLENKINEIEKEFLNAFDKYDYYIKMYKDQKQAVSLANKAYKTSLSRFEVGQTNATELNDAERSLTQSKQALHTTILELHIIKANIEKLTKNIDYLY